MCLLCAPLRTVQAHKVDVRQTLAAQASERNGDQCGCFLFRTEIKLT